MLANVTMTKTKKCDWCNKRKKVDDMYRLGKLKETDRQGKTKLEDFKKWRREIMEDIYNDYINQNKDE